jgi:hypothetical protein
MGISSNIEPCFFFFNHSDDYQAEGEVRMTRNHAAVKILTRAASGTWFNACRQPPLPITSSNNNS